MTLEELEQYRRITQEIKLTRSRLQELRASLEPRSPRLDGMPPAPGPHDLIGDVVPDIVDQERDLLQLLQDQEAQRWKIFRWIVDITDARVRLITMMRIWKGLQWEQIADRIGEGATGPGCGKLFHRYLRKYGG